MELLVRNIAVLKYLSEIHVCDITIVNCKFCNCHLTIRLLTYCSAVYYFIISFIVNM